MPCLSRGNRSPEGIRSGSPARFQRSRTQADRQYTRLRLPQEKRHNLMNWVTCSPAIPNALINHPYTRLRLVDQTH